jgi:hypothetical protein
VKLRGNVAVKTVMQFYATFPFPAFYIEIVTFRARREAAAVQMRQPMPCPNFRRTGEHHDSNF